MNIQTHEEEQSMKKCKKIQRIIKKCYFQYDEELDLTNKSNDWMDVLQAQSWTHLRKADLRGCCIKTQQIQAITRLISQLQQLQLWENKLNTHGISELMKADWPELISLNLYDNMIQNQGIALLIKNIPQKLQRLQKINIGKNNIGSLGIRPLLNSNLQNIQELVFSSNNIGPNGVKLLCKAQLNKIYKIWVSDCKLGNQGAQHLNKGNWPNLKSLSLNDNRIGIDGYSAFGNNNWHKLNFMHVGEIEPISCLLIVKAKLARQAYIGRDLQKYILMPNINDIYKIRSLK